MYVKIVGQKPTIQPLLHLQPLVNLLPHYANKKKSHGEIKRLLKCYRLIIQLGINVDDGKNNYNYFPPLCISDMWSINLHK